MTAGSRRSATTTPRHAKPRSRRYVPACWGRRSPRSSWGTEMPPFEDEDALLHSVALQNAQTILQARQQGERALLRAKEALEARTEELARSLALMQATLESTTDAILATDERGRVTCYNANLVQMWELPA